MLSLIDTYILTWAGQHKQAEKYESLLRPIVGRCTVINAGDEEHKDWVNVGDTRGTTYPTMFSRFDATHFDSLFAVCADAVVDIVAVVKYGAEFMYRYPIGVYAPNFTHCGWPYDKENLRHIKDEVYHVPHTDSIVALLHKDVACRVPLLGMAENIYNWGIDSTAIALAHSQGKWVVRDYQFTARHSPKRGYDSGEAERLMREYYAKQPHWLQEAIRRTMSDTTR